MNGMANWSSSLHFRLEAACDVEKFLHVTSAQSTCKPGQRRFSSIIAHACLKLFPCKNPTCGVPCPKVKNFFGQWIVLASLHIVSIPVPIPPLQDLLILIYVIRHLDLSHYNTHRVSIVSSTLQVELQLAWRMT